MAHSKQKRVPAGWQSITRQTDKIEIAQFFIADRPAIILTTEGRKNLSDLRNENSADLFSILYK
jgi:replicative DNA helicase